MKQKFSALRQANASSTDALAPFGVVSLAAGGSEGHGQHMAALRWSQTANFGSLPNVLMPNTFLAHAYDIPDPWSNPQSYDNNCARPDPTIKQYGASCVDWNISLWNQHVAKIAPLVRNNSAPFYMGPM